MDVLEQIHETITKKRSGQTVCMYLCCILVKNCREIMFFVFEPDGKNQGFFFGGDMVFEYFLSGRKLVVVIGSMDHRLGYTITVCMQNY